jgi:hypothetical protein
MRLATAILLAFVVSFGGAIALSQDGPPKTKVSKDAMTDEQLAVYRAVLNDYMKDSRGALNLSNKTYPLEFDTGCMQGFRPEQTDNSSPVVHAFAAAPAPNVVLVDPEQQESKVKEYDPQNLMKKAIDEREPVTDEQLNKSLKLAFSTGLFSVSEIIFDKRHRRAMVGYSFVCGSLCGHGNALVLEKTRNGWKVRKTCSSWIS